MRSSKTFYGIISHNKIAQCHLELLETLPLNVYDLITLLHFGLTDQQMRQLDNQQDLLILHYRTYC